MKALISEVHKRNVLWNRSHPLYKDRITADKEWEAVSQIVGISKYAAKKKWRNLRDQFCKELKKIPKIHSSDSQDDDVAAYPGKWKFFKSLFFLKDTVTPKDTDGPLSPVLYNNTIFTIIEPEIGNEEFMRNIEPEVDNEDSKSNIKFNPEISFIESQQTATSAPNELPRCHRMKKRKRLNKKLNDIDLKLAYIEGKKRALVEASDDENSLFLRSLIPFLRKMGPLRQLRVRNKFQEILLNEMEEMQRHETNLSTTELSTSYSDISATYSFES